MKLQGIIFDLDGVICSTDEYHYRAWKALAVQGFIGSFVKQWNLIMVSTLLAMLPIIILYLFAQKYIVQGMVDGSIK